MPRELPRVSTVQPPDLAAFKGKTLRAYLEELVRWLRREQAATAQPGSPVDRFIAITSSTITANAGTSGPMGYGNVNIKQIQDDRTLHTVDVGEQIEVDSLIYATIAPGRLVIVQLIEGRNVITGLVCP